MDTGMVTRMSVLLKNYTPGAWVEGSGVSRNIGPWDTSDVVGEYARADVVQVRRRRSPPCVHDPTGAARHPPESLDVFDSGLRPECASSSPPGSRDVEMRLKMAARSPRNLNYAPTRSAWGIGGGRRSPEADKLPQALW